MLTHAHAVAERNPDDAMRRTRPVLLSPAGVAALPLVLLAFGMLWDWGRPGLYMDAINPEYLARWVLHGDDGIRLGEPGNALLGRLPVFTGSVYHGSTQLYFSLPFFAVLGINLASWRIVQFTAASIMVVLVARLTRVSVAGKRLGPVVGLLAAAGLALDPGFVLALRTQAYSCVFPVGLLLGALALLRVGQDTKPSNRRRLIAGSLYGLAVFSYFIFMLFGPAMLWILWRSTEPGRVTARMRAYAPWLAGVFLGYLPFVIGVLLIANKLGGLGQALHYLHSVSETLHVGARQTGLAQRVEATVRETRWTVNGDWVSQMTVRRFAGAAGGVRAATGAATIALGVLVSVCSRSNARCRRALQSVFALLASFVVGSLVFGDRLGGHHFAALLPLWYLAFGLSLALVGRLLVSLASNRSSAWRHTASLAVAAVGCTVAGLGIAGQVTLHRDFQRTGGAGLYSQAITALGVYLESHAHGATVITPDWGYALPVQFLAGDKATVLMVPATSSMIGSQVCKQRAVAVVSTYPTNLDFPELARGSGTTLKPIELWEQYDGTPLFELAWFTSTRVC